MSDLISKQAVIAIINKVYQKYGNPPAAYFKDVLIQTFENLPDKVAWCYGDPPTDKTEYLCVDKDGVKEVGYYSIGNYTHQRWFFNDDSIIGDVVAWMPLPKFNRETLLILAE